jgi:hypothetical protein
VALSAFRIERKDDPPMQKIVSLYLSAWKLEHGTVEEHLDVYLSDGWRVLSVTAAGGTDTFNGLNAWAVVVLEK